MTRATLLAGAALVLAAPLSCAQAEPAEAFPGVTLDREARTVEFSGEVPIIPDAGDGTVVFLEVMVCVRDTKEHEALVVTDVRPSHVHAALLALGLEPGEPGGWRKFGDAVRGYPPSGPPVKVEFIYEKDGEEVVEPAASWVKRDDNGEPLPDRPWVFAGSRMADRGGGERYDADGTGLLVGLTTFGSEVVAYPRLYAHDSAIEEPVWIADPERTPGFETSVTVRLTAFEAGAGGGG